MNHCPSCGMPLKDGLEFCPPTKTMRDTDGTGPGRPKFVFIGCRELRLDNLIKDTVMRRGPSAGRAPKGLTDYQRAEKAYGKNCILSEFGPLPTEREMQGKYVDHSAWERPESKDRPLMSGFEGTKSPAEDPRA